jgi:hypothetical protein
VGKKVGKEIFSFSSIYFCTNWHFQIYTLFKEFTIYFITDEMILFIFIIFILKIRMALKLEPDDIKLRTLEAATANIVQNPSFNALIF